MDEKIIIIDEKSQNEGFFTKIKNKIVKFCLSAVSILTILGILYLTIMVTIYFIGLLLAVGIIGYLWLKFKSK